MNRKWTVLLYIYLIYIIAGIHPLHAGLPKLERYGKGHVNVNTYSGTVQSEGLTLRLIYQGDFRVEEGWSISVVANPKPHNNNGKIFPVDKISYEPIRTEGTVNYPGPIPTIEQIGIPYNSRWIANGETWIIPSAMVPLVNEDPNNNGRYFDLQMKFDLVVQGGIYLKEYRVTSGVTYKIVMEFRFYDNNKVLRSTVSFNQDILVSGLHDPEPSEDTYSIQVLGDARVGSLELRTIQDYANGTSVTYENALEVKASKGYQVSVQSANPQFTSSAGKEMPLNMVSVALQPKQQGSTVTSSEISHQNKLIATGNDTGNDKHLYDIRYFTKPDNQLINISPDEYSTTLIYKLTPN